jgi:anti-anti-sigma factor
MVTADMHVTIDDEQPKVRLAYVDGVLDVFTSPVLVTKALAGLPDTARKLVIDLRDVSFVDSAGISALVRLGEEAQLRAMEVHTRLGRAQERINTTVLDVIRRVMPCDD